MSGLVKPKEYKISESNIANLGSDMEKQAKKAASETEKAWAGCGKVPGLQIWRIEKFQVVSWPKEQYGKFYDGDSYILLHTYEKDKDGKKNRVMKDGKWVEMDGALGWDIHFWLGSGSSQDEMGTAAYKTVELDDFLDGAPLQWREVQGCESEQFRSYFPTGIQLLSGGIESGFKKVTPKEYKARLLHVKGKKNCRVTQVELSYKSLNSGDVFILDNGLTVVQWNGQKSSVAERRKAAEMCQAIRDERGGTTRVLVNEEGNEDKEFWDPLGGKGGPIASAEEGGDDDKAKFTRSLFRVSDASGSLKFTKEAEGTFKTSQLDSNDVFILDTGSEAFVWLGKGATKQEKEKAFDFATQYLEKEGRPKGTPVCRVLDGGEPRIFLNHFN